jgi:hypothetical protein
MTDARQNETPILRTGVRPPVRPRSCHGSSPCATSARMCSRLPTSKLDRATASRAPAPRVPLRHPQLRRRDPPPGRAGASLTIRTTSRSFCTPTVTDSGLRPAAARMTNSRRSSPRCPRLPLRPSPWTARPMATSRRPTARRRQRTSPGRAYTIRCRTRGTTFPRRLPAHSPAPSWNWRVFGPRGRVAVCCMSAGRTICPCLTRNDDVKRAGCGLRSGRGFRGVCASGTPSNDHDLERAALERRLQSCVRPRRTGARPGGWLGDARLTGGGISSLTGPSVETVIILPW